MKKLTKCGSLIKAVLDGDVFDIDVCRRVEPSDIAMMARDKAVVETGFCCTPKDEPVKESWVTKVAPMTHMLGVKLFNGGDGESGKC